MRIRFIAFYLADVDVFESARLHGVNDHDFISSWLQKLRNHSVIMGSGLHHDHRLFPKFPCCRLQCGKRASQTCGIMEDVNCLENFVVWRNDAHITKIFADINARYWFFRHRPFLLLWLDGASNHSCEVQYAGIVMRVVEPGRTQPT